MMDGGDIQSSAEDTSISSSSTPAKTPTNRYFIMKSLTKEDLSWSVNNNVWATQPHNEAILNDAFKVSLSSKGSNLIDENSQNVYLIFSVNKSGEFFGYARMTSEINDPSSAEALKNRETQSDQEPPNPPVVIAGPKTTVTPRTGTAPRGKIFEDEARGTVFWEVAESSEDEEGEDEGEQPRPDDKWGNPFKIEWVKWFLCLPKLLC
jgi:hypothetical protein